MIVASFRFVFRHNGDERRQSPEAASASAYFCSIRRPVSPSPRTAASAALYLPIHRGRPLFFGGGRGAAPAPWDEADPPERKAPPHAACPARPRVAPPYALAGAARVLGGPPFRDARVGKTPPPPRASPCGGVPPSPEPPPPASGAGRARGGPSCSNSLASPTPGISPAATGLPPRDGRVPGTRQPRGRR